MFILFFFNCLTLFVFRFNSHKRSAYSAEGLHIQLGRSLKILGTASDILKSKAFAVIRVGPSVRPERKAFFVDLGISELFNRFQTSHDNSCSS